MKPKLFMMCGLPASGKSHYTDKLKDQNVNIHSSDKIREELTSDVNSQDMNDKVFQLLHKRIKEDLLNNKDTCYDATNINYKRRMFFLQEIKNIECEKICIFVATPYQDCLKQNASRERSIPENVITRMYKNFYIPQYYEGWDKIEIIWNYNKYDFDIEDYFVKTLYTFNQDNIHHTLTVGSHCRKCAEEVQGFTDNDVLFAAAFLHDIGKPFTKSFVNKKGETTENAHYYQHHLVSAYDALFYLKSDGFDSDEFILEVCNYIQWHMQPFFIETEKARTKFINLIGEEFYNNLMILHKADKLAKLDN